MAILSYRNCCLDVIFEISKSTDFCNIFFLDLPVTSIFLYRYNVKNDVYIKLNGAANQPAIFVKP